LAERAAKTAAKVLQATDPYIREFAAFLQELESGHAITMAAAQFHELFCPEPKLSRRDPAKDRSSNRR
jgi:hypothetical protein